MHVSNLKKGSALDFVLNPSNWRDELDIPAIAGEILEKGRIVEPVYIEEGTNHVLKGNRRIAGAQLLLKRGDLDPAIRKALTEQVQYFVVSKFSSEKEKTEFTLDHGSQKPLSRVEIVKAVWRLAKMMYSERDIISLLYMQLGKYTGNDRKAYEASQLPNGPERNKFLLNWLHGTVGNFLLTVATMGEKVMEQLILTELASDRALTDDEKKKIVFKVNRARVKDLNTAKEKDKKSGGWSPEAGGEEFNKLIEQYREEDADPTKKGGKKGPSQKEMAETANMYQSGFRMAFLKCAGELPENDTSAMVALDAEYHRRDGIYAIVTAMKDKIVNPDVKAVVDLFLSGNKDNVAETFAPYIQG